MPLFWVLCLISTHQAAAQTVSPIPTCPAGWTCTPVVPTPVPVSTPTPVCPVGYTCVYPATTTPPVISSSDATATIAKRSTLVLTYDSSRKEAMLSATFFIAVNGATNGINIYKNNVEATFINQKGVSYNTNSETNVINVIGGRPVTTVDSFGQTLYVVPAHQTVVFQMVSTVDPKQLFAGSYYASAPPILMAVVGTDAYQSFKFPIPSATTNIVTIVGEVAPYITAVTTPISPGQTMTITGQRLSGTILIDGGIFPSTQVVGATNGTSLAFTLPYFPAGYHSITVNNSSTGLSNQVGFQVQGSSTPVSGTQIIATLDPGSPLSSTIQVPASTSIQNIPVAVFDLNSQNNSSTLKALLMNFSIQNADISTPLSSFFSNIFIKVGGQVYQGSNPGGRGEWFNNLNISLPANSYVPITVYVNTNSAGANLLDGARLNAILNAATSSIQAVDTNGNTVLTTGGKIYANTITFSLNSAQISNTSFAVSPTTTSGNYNRYPSQTIFNGSLTITAGNSPLYISTNGATALTTVVNSSPSIGTNLAATVTTFTPSNGTQSYDSSTAYEITPGSSRVFNFNGVLALNNAASTTQILASVGIASINLNTSSTLATSTAVFYATPLQGLNSDFHIAGAYLSGSGVTTTQLPSLKVSLDPASPMQGTYSAPQSNVTLAIVDLGAGQNPVTNLNNIQIGSNSTNASNLVSNIKVYLGSTLLGTAANLAYNGSYYYQWIPVSNVNIPANQGVPLRIVADLSSVSATSTVRIGIAGLNFSGSGANTTGLPVYGSSMYLIPTGGTTQQPTITVLSPNGGENIIAGQPYTIKWSTSNAPTGSTVMLELLTYGKNGNPLSNGCGSGILIANDYVPNTGSYQWTNTSNFLNPYGYTFKVCATLETNQSVANDTSNSTFSIVSATSTPVNLPPVINGGTFPVSLNVGQTGTWTLNASDPQNGSLSYSVDWGDTTTCPVGYTCATPAAKAIQQSTTFTHSYSAAGTYTIKFTVQNAAGLTAYTTATVVVKNVVPPVYVCPAGYTCAPVGTTPACPVGYTCTPVTSNCPQGFVCNFNSPTPIKLTASSSTPVVPVTTTPPTNSSASYNSSSVYNPAGTPVTKTANAWDSIANWFSSFFQ